MAGFRRFITAPERQQPLHQIMPAAGLLADAQERFIIQEIGLELQQEAADRFLSPPGGEALRVRSAKPLQTR